LGQAFRFYSLTLLAFVGLILLTLLPSAVTVVQSIRSGEWQMHKSIVAGLYPENLTLTVNRDTVTTNQAGPVVIPLPKAWRAMAECDMRRCVREELPANLLVIDTVQPINQSDFETLDTVAILGAQEVGFHNPERGETRIFNLKEAGFKETFTLTAPLFHEWVDRGFKALQIGLFVVAFFIPGVLYVGLWIGYLVYALLGALVVWLAAHIQGHKIAYGRAYLSTLYLYPVPFAFSSLMSLSHHHIPFVFSLVLFVMALLNFPKPPKLPDPVKIAPADTPTVPKVSAAEKKPSEEKN
jgi:hypothetical protein